MNQNKSNTGAYESATKMEQPPNVITTKDLSYLKDALSWELLAMKKCHHFASHCTDQEIQNQLNGVGQMHQKHYDRLLQYVQSNPNQNYLQ
jgi:hypothetical protein